VDFKLHHHPPSELVDIPASVEVVYGSHLLSPKAAHSPCQGWAAIYFFLIAHHEERPAQIQLSFSKVTRVLRRQLPCFSFRSTAVVPKTQRISGRSREVSRGLCAPRENGLLEEALLCHEQFVDFGSQFEHLYCVLPRGSLLAESFPARFLFALHGGTEYYQFQGGLASCKDAPGSRNRRMCFATESGCAPAQVVFSESQLFLRRQQSRALFPARVGANALWYSS